MENFIVRIVGYEDYWATAEIRRSADDEYRRMMREAISHHKITIKRPAREESAATVAVSVYKQVVDAKTHKPTEQLLRTFNLQPPFAPMTSDEYYEALAHAVETLPQEFQDFVCEVAHEDGHSAGFEEVVSIAASLTHSLLPAVTKYNARMLATRTPGMIANDQVRETVTTAERGSNGDNAPGTRPTGVSPLADAGDTNTRKKRKSSHKP